MDDDGTEATKNASDGPSGDPQKHSKNSLTSIKEEIQAQKTKDALEQFWATLPDKAKKNRAVIDLFKSRSIEVLQ